MPKQNAPAHEGEGVMCQLAGDTGAYTTAEMLRHHRVMRAGIPLRRAALVAALAFGGGAHG